MLEMNRDIKHKKIIYFYICVSAFCIVFTLSTVARLIIMVIDGDPSIDNIFDFFGRIVVFSIVLPFIAIPIANNLLFTKKDELSK